MKIENINGCNISGLFGWRCFV